MSIRVLTIIGARPQIIKAAAISRAIRNRFPEKITEIILHTGQHYDANMSQVFFDELGIPAPDYNLNVGSGSHGRQTAAMITGIEEVLIKEKPDGIVLYGDTNSTLAGAVAAGKLHVPVIHIEAGLRSFNKSMPEEINRIVCDHVSTLLFSPTKTGFENLRNEGFKADAVPPFSADNPAIYHCGDVMYDNSLYFSEVAENKTDIVQKLGLGKDSFALATIHRNNNTDDPHRLTALMAALQNISEAHGVKVVLPLHPRTSGLLNKNVLPEVLKKIRANNDFLIIPPVSFLEMIALEKRCVAVLTDSGGVQKEAFYFKKPCVIMRSETEWTELVDCGAAIVADADEKRIVNAYEKLVSVRDMKFPELYGDGHAAEFICWEMVKYLEVSG
jgi:UDP-GlcNAc3NAcA epimerase